MAWTIRLLESARRDLKKIDRKASDRIVSFLYKRLSSLDSPRMLGIPLGGNLRGHWRYRVGDYRIIRNFDDDELVVLVIEIGNRRDIYR